MENQSLKKLIKPKTSKIFETVLIWLLSLCLLTKISLLYMLVEVIGNVKENTTAQVDFTTLVLKFLKHENALKVIESTVLIYRTFLFILIIVFSMFIIFRISKKEFEKLLYLNTIIIGVTVVFSGYLVYLTKDLFFALKQINHKYFSLSLEKAIFLTNKIQYMKILEPIILIVFIISIVGTIFAILINLYELLLKDETAPYKKINSSIFILCLIGFSGLVYWNYDLYKNKNLIRPFDNFLLGYTHNKSGEIQLRPYVNLKKIDKKYLDYNERDLLSNHIDYEILNPTEVVKKGKEVKIIASYDFDRLNELGLKIKDLTETIIIEKEPFILKEVDDLSINKLYKFMKKYDTRFIAEAIDEKDNITGVYATKNENNMLEIYVVQFIPKNLVDEKNLDVMNARDKGAYLMIYLGVTYIDDDKNILSYESLNNLNGYKYFNEKDVKEIKDDNNFIKIK